MFVFILFFYCFFFGGGAVPATFTCSIEINVIFLVSFSFLSMFVDASFHVLVDNHARFENRKVFMLLSVPLLD